MAKTAELLTWKGNYYLKLKEEQLNTIEAQLVDRANNMYDPKQIEQCVNNALPFKKLQELTTQYKKDSAKMQETQAKADEALAYVQGKAAAATEISAEAKGYSEGLEEASRLWAEKRKKEQAEEQQAEEQEQQALSEERSMKKQKQANKNQKQQRQNWSAAIEEDNKKYSTPKGSGSKSRGTGR